jgi:hypothetical protein
MAFARYRSRRAFLKNFVRVLTTFRLSAPLSGMRIVLLACLGCIALGCSSSGSDSGAASGAGAGTLGGASGVSVGGGGAVTAGSPASGGSIGSASAGSEQGGDATAGSSAAGAAGAAGSVSPGGAGAGAGGASTGGGGAGHGGSTGSAGSSSSGGSGGGAATGKWWKPGKSTTFYWDLQNAPPDNTKNVGAYDIDGWGNSAQEVTTLHARGIKVVCYMDAGTYEPGRPDSSSIPAALKGSGVQGWPGELWLDVRPAGASYAALQAVMLARFKECQKKGFDAVEPDNLDSYQNKPGFPTTAADQLAYNEWIASSVHALGLAVFQKNDLDQVKQLEPFFDGILDEECNKYSECDTLAPYTAASKPVWDAEYKEDGETTAKFCASNIKVGIVGALFALDLDGSLFEPCDNDVGILN